MHGDSAELHLVAIVDMTAGHAESGQQYEDEVLTLLGRHGATLERRMRSTDGTSEVHLIRVRSRADLAAYMADPDRLALRERYGAAAPTTRVIEVGGF
jgi:hypothetical protein